MTKRDGIKSEQSDDDGDERRPNCMAKVVDPSSSKLPSMKTDNKRKKLKQEMDGDDDGAGKGGRNSSNGINNVPSGQKDDFAASIVTLSSILEEKQMVPSRDYNNRGEWIGKGPRNERELLRFYSFVGELPSIGTGRNGSKSWEWSSDDINDLPKVSMILDRYKKDGLRAPSRGKYDTIWNALKESRNLDGIEWTGSAYRLG